VGFFIVLDNRSVELSWQRKIANMDRIQRKPVDSVCNAASIFLSKSLRTAAFDKYHQNRQNKIGNINTYDQKKTNFRIDSMATATIPRLFGSIYISCSVIEAKGLEQTYVGCSISKNI
jgi:hypothetical protein